MKIRKRELLIRKIKENNGIITTKEVMNLGIHKDVLKELTIKKELEKFIYKKYLHEFGFSKTENPTEEEIQPDNIYQMHGNQITVKTLDLNQKFDIIAKQLDDIVKNHFDI